MNIKEHDYKVEKIIENTFSEEDKSDDPPSQKIKTSNQSKLVKNKKESDKSDGNSDKKV